ncbi:MAG TPA: hypothetical protein VJO53_11305 [Candidatus Acidoferrales bacterium]|nr:hypothetical protein [Candidatus Acidoferrales bacterium]
MSKKRAPRAKRRTRPKLLKKKKRTRKPGSRRGKRQVENPIAFEHKGLGSRAGGQSGDIEGLSGRAFADSESVEELAEEGQSFEAEVIEGVEGARDPDEAEVESREVPEDDFPTEYEHGGES